MSTQLPENPLSRSERMWAMFTHLAALSCFIGIPFGNIFGPLIMWMIKKEQYPFVNEQGKAALNYQISVMLYIALSLTLIILMAGATRFGVTEVFVAGAFLLGAILITDFIQIIVAAVNANDGKSHKYPMAIRFIK